MGVDIHVGMDSDNDIEIEVRDQYHPRNNPQLDGGGDPPADSPKPH